MGKVSAIRTVTANPAKAAGLTFRTLEDTVRSAMAWYHSRPAAEQEKLRAGISPEREREVLAAWHAQQGGGR